MTLSLLKGINGPTLSTPELIAAGEYLTAGTNWYISGNTGCGKTMLACAMGWRAAENGYSVKFLRMPDLLHDLCIGDDRWKKNLRERLKRFHVLILDDYGIDMLNASQAEFLYNVVEDRYLRKPVILTTQIDFESRRDPVSDDSPHTREALCDRLFPEGSTRRVKLTGPSRRGTKDEIRG
ncbi:MAG TPA: ATP-binding protein [Candidatus Avisuccinivibrio pullicola]|nr:ATP-binding protein [Candidatus Avisuccinivibrio pullicola]